MVLKAKNKTKQREILLWGLFHIAFCFIRVFLSIRCNTSAFGNFLMFPKEISRSFLWKHEKNGHKNIPWILGRTDGENTYNS